MNEVLLLILNYLPPAVSVGALIFIGKKILKIVISKLEDITAVKNKLNFICKKLADQHQENEDLKKQINSLIKQQRGFKDEEVSKN